MSAEIDEMTREPSGSRFMFWCTAPFLIACVVVIPLAARPPSTLGWVALGALEILFLLVLLGFYDSNRFWWCWRATGAFVFLAYSVYLIVMIADGKWFGDGRRSSTTAFNAICGLLVFGLPGLWFALFGRLTLRRHDDDCCRRTTPDDERWGDE